MLPCTSPVNAIYTNMKVQELAVMARLNGRATARSVWLFWPVINNAGQYGQTRLVGETEWPDRVWPMRPLKNNVGCVNMRTNSRSRP